MSVLRDDPITLLRLIPSISETSSTYNQFSLAVADRQNITICTYNKPRVSVPETIEVFPGDGTVRGYLRALEAAVRAKEYDVVHAHHPNVSFPFVVRALLRDRQMLRASVHTEHSSFPNYKPRNRLMVLPILASYRRVVFCSRSSFESFPGLYRRLAGNRVRIVQNGVDLDRIDRTVDGQFLAQSEKFRILTVGRLISLKKPLSILHAFHQARIPQAELVFVGEGELREEIVAESERLGLQEQVQFTGLIQREEVYQQLVNADLFVSASTIEGLPVAVLEALACRCPVVLSDIPPHREVTRGLEFVPLVSVDDETGLAQEIKRFSRMSTLDRQELGSLCRQHVEEHFSLSLMHQKYKEIYDQVRVNVN